VKHLASFLLLVAVLVLNIACSAERTPVQINFAAAWEGQPLGCDDAEVTLTDLRFFVSDIFLTDSVGVERELILTPDNPWQQKGVALIDLENAEGSCLNGTSDINTAISGSTEIADIASVRFTVGVPFSLNHANPLLAEPPLDRSAMHWHWRSGYKFLRAGVSTASDGFWIHLGSTGCEGAVQNISGCRFPNRVSVVIPKFSPDSDRIVIELAELFREVDLTDASRSDCSSGLAESACVEPFAALGLEFGTDAGSTTPQRVFRAQP